MESVRRYHNVRDAVAQHPARPTGLPSRKTVRPPSSICLAAALCLGLAATGIAQSANQRGAWDALMLSPFGALPGRIVSTDATARSREVSLRYGRWEYDTDDAAHDNFGVTIAQELPFGRTEIALTGAYLSLQCGGCSNWKIVGADVETSILNGALTVRDSRVAARIGIRSSFAGARNSGDEASNALSAAIAVPIGLGFAIGRYSYLDVAVSPGLGYGRIVGVGRRDSGIRPALSAGGVLRLRSGFGVQLGVQKVMIDGGPSQLGVGLSWGLGSRRRSPLTIDRDRRHPT